METDAALLSRYVRERAQDAFAELTRRRIDAVYSMALRRVGGDAHLAQDVTQEVFVALARQAIPLACHPELLGWLFTTTRNITASVVRRERRRKAHEQETQRMQEVLAKGPPEPDWTAVAPLLEDALDELSDSDRTAILLRFFGRHTFAEIGATLQLTEDAARKRVDRGLDRLHARLARSGMVSSGAALGVILASHAVGAAPTGLATAVTGAALTAPAAVLTTASGVIGIIQSTKLTLGVGLVMVAALSTAVYEIAVCRTSETALAFERAATDAAFAHWRAAEADAQNAERDIADFTRHLESARAHIAIAASPAVTGPSATAVAPREASAAAMIAAGNAFLARHPEVKRALVDLRRAGVNRDYAPFFKSLALPPAQLEELKTLLMNLGDQFTGPYGPNGAFVDLRAGDISRTEVLDRLHAFLGDDGFRQFEGFLRTVEPRRLTAKVTSALALSEAPLTTDQANRLVGVLADNRSDGFGFDWNAVSAGARAFLSTAQLATFQRVQTQTQAEYATINAAEASVPATAITTPNPTR